MWYAVNTASEEKAPDFDPMISANSSQFKPTSWAKLLKAARFARKVDDLQSKAQMEEECDSTLQEQLLQYRKQNSTQLVTDIHAIAVRFRKYRGIESIWDDEKDEN